MSEQVAKKSQRAAAPLAEQPPADEMPERVTMSPPEPEAIDAGAVVAAELGPPEIQSPEDFSSDLMARLKTKHLPTGKDALKAGEIIKRRRVTFDVDGAQCEPGMFVNEAGDYVTFKITLESLNSAQEVAALRGIKDGAQAPMLMAKHTLVELNGKKLEEAERDFVWECLGMGGRQVCFAAFQLSLGAAAEAGLGKYLLTRSEG